MLPHQQPSLPSHPHTPEDEDPSSSSSTAGSSWWGDWQQTLIDTVRQKSMQAVEMVKKDFNDFVETSVVLSDAAITNDEEPTDNNCTRAAGSADAAGVEAEDGVGDDESVSLGGLNMETIGSATNVMKEGMFNFLQSVSELIAIPPDTVSETETGDADNAVGKGVEFDIKAYLESPGGKFDEWVKGFDIHAHQHRMANILVQSPGVGDVYAQFVPAKLSHKLFWQRYFYNEFLNKEKKEEEEEELQWEDEEEEKLVEEEKHEKGEVTKKDAPGVLNVKLEEESTEKKKGVVNDEKVLEGKKEGKQLMERVEKDEKKQDERKGDEVHTEKKDGCLENLPEEDNRTRRRSLTPTPPDSGDDVATPTVSDDEEDSAGEKTAPKKHSPNSSDTSSVGSWLSIDDVIKVKRVDGEQQVSATMHSPANEHDDITISDQTDSASLLSDVSDEEFDLDVDEAEIAKMVEEIKMKKPQHINPEGDDEDDDWEKWE